MKKKDKKSIEDLDKIIEEYMNSGKTMSEFIKEHIFKEYGESGNKELADIAADYFLDHLQ